MRTTIVIDEQLLKKLLEIGGFSTKKEAIRTAIERFIEQAERQKLVDMAGSVEFESGHLPKLVKLEDEEMQ